MFSQGTGADSTRGRAVWTAVRAAARRAARAGRGGAPDGAGGQSSASVPAFASSVPTSSSPGGARRHPPRGLVDLDVDEHL
ncbi:hypothetical protein, partial [Corynebacterium bovis]|uniref:hypothetical protein n=1 Tax=Corynebacterium bovis TaxID=36808 RepID=UPI0027B8D5F5